MAAAGPGDVRATAPGAGAARRRVRRIRAMDGRPAAAILQGACGQARHEGRPLSRCCRGRAVRWVRRLERAVRDLAPSRRRSAAGSLEHGGTELGAGRLQRRRPRNPPVRTVPRHAQGLDAPCRRDPARSRAGAAAALSGSARFSRPQRRLCADAVRCTGGRDRAGKRGASLRRDRRRPRHRAGRLSRADGRMGHLVLQGDVVRARR